MASSRSTTASGYINANCQRVVRPTGLAGTDHLQRIYVLSCGPCGNEYGANGSDIWQRKCPACQGGEPGLPFEANAVETLDARTVERLVGGISLNMLSEADLLRGFGAIVEELRSRGLCRTNNNPVAGYSEWLVSKRLGLQLNENSSTGYDASDAGGMKYEIKARRVTSSNPSLQLSVIRGLNKRHFDFLVGVVFEADFSIRYAAKLPHELVVRSSVYRQHVNGHILHLTRAVVSQPGAIDITDLLR